ncbi:23 kDa integral membrane protein-like [Acanthaster planci]|uniref:Tetraspanin n=1 Tax=Acanthaster planci TaxID=133434 RepID=A0A8B7XGP1_ACAPL|nr:23 kDa integral membrane protein-like [Acanthaster planci]XP_022079110.1 23 kDa integral membrane protein-like [Acanthaster planci]XP_022079111.1 23 kDa integral membrane protein-like [Acanthaster planci]
MGLAGCFRVLLFIENFIFWLIGTALIIVGAYVLVAPELPAFLKILEGTQVICYVAIGVGGCLFIIGFLGCCGAFKKNPCLLKTYAGILIILVILEVTGAILIWQLEEKIVYFLSFGWNTLDANSVNIIQQQFTCCGFNSPGETTLASLIVPPSCRDSSGEAFKIGCYDKLKQTINENIVISASVAGAVAFLQVVSIIVSCILGREEKPTRVRPIPGGRQAWSTGGYA